MEACYSPPPPSIKTGSSKDSANALSLPALTDGNTSRATVQTRHGGQNKTSVSQVCDGNAGHRRARRDLEYVKSLTSQVNVGLSAFRVSSAAAHKSKQHRGHLDLINILIIQLFSEYVFNQI